MIAVNIELPTWGIFTPFKNDVLLALNGIDNKEVEQILHDYYGTVDVSRVYAPCSVINPPKKDTNADRQYLLIMNNYEYNIEV